jgi:hypothetical protein
LEWSALCWRACADWISGAAARGSGYEPGIVLSLVALSPLSFSAAVPFGTVVSLYIVSYTFLKHQPACCCSTAFTFYSFSYSYKFFIFNYFFLFLLFSMMNASPQVDGTIVNAVQPEEVQPQHVDNKAKKNALLSKYKFSLNMLQ